MPTDLSAILSLEVPLIVQLGQRSMRVGDVVRLMPGSIVELPQSPDDPLALMVNNKIIGRGVAVKVGENFGMRITAIGNVAQRVQALGDEESEGEATGAPEAESPAPAAKP